MLRIDLNVDFIREGLTGGASLALERKKGETWNRETVIDFTPGKPDAKRTLPLEPDQRLVIYGHTKAATRYDKEQMAHVAVDVDDKPDPVVLPPKPAEVPPVSPTPQPPTQSDPSPPSTPAPTPPAPMPAPAPAPAKPAAIGPSVK